jgi:hypothetical protein
MKRIERAFLYLFGGTVATIGAVFACWGSVTMYFLLTGRIQSGEENPPFLLAAAFFTFGMLLLIAGYWVQRRTLIQPRTDDSDHSS